MQIIYAIIYSMDKEKLLTACRKYGIVFMGVFGSYARGQQTPQSDLDLLVKFSNGKSLLEMVKIEREMSQSLGIKVDLLTEKAISPYLRERITNGLQVLYDKQG
mgnify:FL=1